MRSVGVRLSRMLRSTAAAAIVMAGCRSGQPKVHYLGDAEFNYYKGHATEIDYPALDCPTDPKVATTESPHTLLDVDELPIRDMTLEEAIQIGLKNAMAMMLTGRHIDAQEAYRIGLVQEVCPAAQLMERAMAWADEISQCAPLSVRATKEVAMKGLAYPLQEAMKAHYDGISKLFSSEDFIEGPMAFAQKRKPQWKGR